MTPEDGILRYYHTCSHLYLGWLLSMDQVGHISLRGVGIAIFQDKELVHSIFLECREIDKEVDWPGQSFANDKILFPSDLDEVQKMIHEGGGLCLTHAFKKIEQIFARLCS
jgi:hypothetical protein